MKIFYKFHGTGNDFILLACKHWKSELSRDLISNLCNRHTGIGADGLILIGEAKGYDFEMIYYNSDGSLARMCGNGARCAVAFANFSGICGNKCSFLAGDGSHTATVAKVSASEWMVEVSINDVDVPIISASEVEINTGTRHLVLKTTDTEIIDVLNEGRKIRNSEKFAAEGINVNWYSLEKNQIKVRTYERGVEAETLSCGTGVTATAIVAAMHTGISDWEVLTKGGLLSVSMRKENTRFTNIRLKGPAKMVFKAELSANIHQK